MKQLLLLCLLFTFFFSIFSKGIVGQVYAATYVNCTCDDKTGKGHTAKCVEKSSIGGQDQPVNFTCGNNPENPQQKMFCKDAPGFQDRNFQQNIDTYGIKCLRTPEEAPIEVKETWKGCTCDSANQVGEKKNGYTCEGGKKSSCLTTNMMCVLGGSFNNLPGKHTAEGISCRSITSDCTCTNPDTVGKNQFTCKDPATGQAGKPVDCGNQTICKNSAEALSTIGGVSYKGISCVDDTSSQEPEETPWPTNPPPPSPPCADFNSTTGVCNTIDTAFGQVSTTPSQFITKVFAIFLSISGGLALFLTVKGSYIIMTSRGKPEQLQNGRDQLVATIVGLLFLIFSFVILEVIATDILKVQ